MELCKPATAILLVAVAGVIYHLLAADYNGIIWWLIVGIFGTGVFQGLCYGGIEPIAWIVMAVPVLIVCFFLAVALFASSMRIENVRRVPCNRCGQQIKPCCKKPKPCGCSRPRKRCGCQQVDA